MARQAQPDHPVAFAVQGLAQRAQAVGRIRHAVQQQHAAFGLRARQLETVIPVRRARARIGGAARAVPDERIRCGLRRMRIDRFVELGEEALLELEIIVEIPHFGAVAQRELLGQMHVMPLLEPPAGAALQQQGRRQRAQRRNP